MSKKILVLYTSTGLGHKSLAENIGQRLEQAGYLVRLADGYELQPSQQLDQYNKLHLWVYNRAPYIWRWLYNWGYLPMLPLRVFMARFHHRNVKKLIDDFGPDLVVSTQVSVSAVVAYLKRRQFYKQLFAIAFSDFHLHHFWLYKEADYYLVNIVEQLEEMKKIGIPPEKIFVCGMTLKPRLQINAQEVKRRLGIEADKKVVLVSAGSLGIGFPHAILDAIAGDEELSAAAKIIIACGKNETIRGELARKYGNKFIILGFYTPMEELYETADIFVTKPGGLSVAESLRSRLSMLITHFLPGQEEKNIRFLLRKGWIIDGLSAASVSDPSYVISIIKQELTTGAHKKLLEADKSIDQWLKPQGQDLGIVAAVRQMFHPVRRS